VAPLLGVSGRRVRPELQPRRAAGPGGPIPFSRVLSYVERAPTRFIPATARPQTTGRDRQAEGGGGDLRRACVRELKLRMCYDDPDAFACTATAASGLPVTVHIDYEFETGRSYPRPNWWYGGGFDAFERAVRVVRTRLPRSRAGVLGAHLGRRQGISTAYPRVRCSRGKLPLSSDLPEPLVRHLRRLGPNAFARDKEFAREFIAEFQDRILYGRDWFDNGHQELLAELAVGPRCSTRS